MFLGRIIFEFVKYLFLIPNALCSVLGAGIMAAGVIIVVIFEHLLPVKIHLDIIDDLPVYLGVVGSIVFLVTFAGGSGAFFEGSVGKWLLILYVVGLTAVISVTVYVTVILFLNRDNSSEGIVNAIGARIKNVERTAVDPVISTVQNTFNLGSHDETISRKARSISEPNTAAVEQFAKTQESITSHPSENEDIDETKDIDSVSEILQSPKVRNRRQIISWGMEKIRNVGEKVDKTFDISEKANSVIKRVEAAKHNVEEKVVETVHEANDMVNAVVDKAEGIRDDIGSGLAKAKSTLDSGVGTVKSGVNMVKSGVETIHNAAGLVTSVVTGAILEPDDNQYVKLVKPILGMFTKPLFILSKSSKFMAVVMIAILIEVLYVFMALYLCYTKAMTVYSQSQEASVK